MAQTTLNRPRVVVVVLVTCVLVALISLVQGPGAADTTAQLLDISVNMESFPALVAPGANLALNWLVTGGTQVEETCVWWDTVSHEYDKAYRYRTTPFQRWKPMGNFYDYVTVPDGAEAIYLRPYAVVDGTIVWGSRQHALPSLRPINVGSTLSQSDSQGRWWYRDTDFGHHWYGLVGGTPRSTDHAIGGTVDDWIYQTQREGVSGFGCWFNLGVLSMDIEVEFHLAEFQATTPGERVFDVYLEKGSGNEVAIHGIDVYDQAGSYHALVLTRTVTVTDYQLDIAFESVDGLPPILNGLVVHGLAAEPQQRMTQRVVFFDDDTYVSGTANRRGDSTIFLGGEGAYHGGLRFFCIQIPQGSVINHAEIWVTAATDSYQEMNLKIYAHDTDDSPDFGHYPLVLVPDRDRTEHFATWSVPRSEGWGAGRTYVYTSPELSEVVEEVVNRPGWRERNSLSFLLIADQGDYSPREIWAIDGSYDDRAFLLIDFTPSDIGQPTPAPTLTHTQIPSQTPTPTKTHTPTPTNTPTDTPTVTATPTPTTTPTPRRVHLPMVVKPGVKP